MEIQIGTPATFCIGSDKYATEISSIEYYKSGDKKGSIRYLELARGGGIKFSQDSKGYWVQKSGYARARIGEAIDYLDPHF